MKKTKMTSYLFLSIFLVWAELSHYQHIPAPTPPHPKFNSDAVVCEGPGPEVRPVGEQLKHMGLCPSVLLQAQTDK